MTGATHSPIARRLDAARVMAHGHGNLATRNLGACALSKAGEAPPTTRSTNGLRARFAELGKR